MVYHVGIYQQLLGLNRQEWLDVVYFCLMAKLKPENEIFLERGKEWLWVDLVGGVPTYILREKTGNAG